MRGEIDLNLEAVNRLCQVLGLQFCPVAVDATAEPKTAPKKGRKKKK